MFIGSQSGEDFQNSVLHERHHPFLLSQALHLLNGTTIEDKITQGGVVKKLMDSNRTPREIASELRTFTGSDRPGPPEPVDVAKAITSALNIAQNEIRQARGESEDEHPQKTRMSLLQRLANVGLGRRDEENEPPIAARASGPAMAPMPPLPERKPQRTVAQQIATHEPVSEYARRPAPQGLDAHGRPAPVAPAPQGDDHLDIPAFLRRQSS